MTTAQHSETELTDRETTQRANLASMLANPITRDDILDNEAKTLRYLSFAHLADLVENAIEARDNEVADISAIDDLDDLDELDAEPAKKPAKPAKPASKPAKPASKPASKPAKPAKPASKPAKTFIIPPKASRPATAPCVLNYKSGTAGDIINGKHKSASSKTKAIVWYAEDGITIRHRMMLGSVQAEMISLLTADQLALLAPPAK